MPRFRVRPFVDAYQITQIDLDEIRSGSIKYSKVPEWITKLDFNDFQESEDEFLLKSWIIKGPANSFWICPNNEFRATYEQIDYTTDLV